MEKKPLCSNDRTGEPENNKKIHIKFCNVCESIDNKVKPKE